MTPETTDTDLDLYADDSTLSETRDIVEDKLNTDTENSNMRKWKYSVITYYHIPALAHTLSQNRES